jgi:ACS family sodium-dependent inorganic phosphate cotransporter
MPKRFRLVFFAFTCILISYLDRVNLSVAVPVLMKQYGWNSAVVGALLSAFFWGFSISPLLGGWLADRFGGKHVLGFGVMWWSLCTILTPLMGGIAGLTAIRVLLGLGEGVNTPAIQSLASRWFPAQERTRAVALYLSGSHIGTIIGFPVSTWIIASLGWPAVFCIYGVIGLIWAGIWYAFGASSPETHPTITKQERHYIVEHRGALHETSGVPWRRLLSKGPVWGLVLTTFSIAWMVWLFVSWLPTYLIQAHHFSLKESGIYSALPFVANTVGGITSAWLQDRLIASGYSVTVVRKTTLTLAFVGTIAFLLLIPRAQSPMRAVGYLTAAMAIFSAAQGTVMVNNIDIAPRYAGVIVGLQATAGNLAGALSPIMAGVIVLRTGRFDGVFYLITALLIVTAIIWNLLATGERIID